MTAPATEAPAAAVSADQTAEELFEVAPLVTRWIRGEMRRASADSLTVPQLRALLYVRRQPGTNLSGLADHLGVGVATASGLVDRLVRQRLLTRTQDPAERRAMRLELTAEGDARVQRSRGHTRSALAATLSGLSTDQLSAVYQALGLLRTVFQPGPPTGQAS